MINANTERTRMITHFIALMPDADYNDNRENVIDLVTNIRHYCQKKGFDFEEIIRISGCHWEAEK